MIDQDTLQTNAADERQIEHAGRKVRTRERERTALVRKLLSTYEGREGWYADLAPLYAEIDGPIEVVYRALGARTVALRKLAEALQHPELFTQMWNEGVARNKRDARENQAAREAA